MILAVASLGGGPPRVTPSRSDTQTKKKFVWVILQIIVNKRGWTGEKGAGWHPPGGGWHRSEMNKSDSYEQKRSTVFQKEINRATQEEINRGGVTLQNWQTDRQWWLKKVVSFFWKKQGWHPQLLPRMTPTLVDTTGLWHPLLCISFANMARSVLMIIKIEKILTNNDGTHFRRWM